MKKEQQNNSTSNALVTTTTTQGILDNGQKELLAGGKVRSKAGGPEMILVGFTTEKDYFSKGELGSELTSSQLNYLAMKVIMNEEGEYSYYQTFHSQDFYSKTIFDDSHISRPSYYKAEEKYKKYWNGYYNGWEDDISWQHKTAEAIQKQKEARITDPLVLAEYYKYKYNYSSKSFSCLCKYWSNKDEEFKHILLLPSEIEFI